MKKIIIALLFSLLTWVANSQNTPLGFCDRLAVADPATGAKSSIKFDAISHSALSSAVGSQYVNGYRICVFFDNSQDARNLANAALATIKSKFPSLKADPVYTAPIWKVFAGECVTKADANNLLFRLKVYFPKSFIVNEKMDIAKFATRLSYDDEQPVEEVPIEAN